MTKQMLSPRRGDTETSKLTGPAYTLGSSAVTTWTWPAEGFTEDMLAKWMEATCLKCAYEQNEAPEDVWEIACGTGFVMDFEVRQVPVAGSELTITATVQQVLQRQVTFGLRAAAAGSGEAAEAIAEGRHLRAYPTHEEMKAKIADKLERAGKLKPGLTGWYTAVVEMEHTGGARNTAWQPGAVGAAVSTSAMLSWMSQAAASATDNALPMGGWVSRPLRTEVSHLGPTPMGMAVLCTAKLTAVADVAGNTVPATVPEDYDWEGTTLKFALSATDGTQEVVAAGTHTRVLRRDGSS